MPRRDVAVPPPSADPVVVVRTFVQALDERDFSTANTLSPRFTFSWWDPAPWHISHLRIGTVWAPKDSSTKVSSAHIPANVNSVGVDTSAGFQNWDNGQPDTPDTGWSYILERNGPNAPWRITSWGQG